MKIYIDADGCPVVDETIKIVDVVLKKDQVTGALTRGHVKRILTKSAHHPNGIKVMLVEGDQVG